MDCKFRSKHEAHSYVSILIYLSLHRFSIATEQNYYTVFIDCCQSILVILAPRGRLELPTSALTVPRNYQLCYRGIFWCPLSDSNRPPTDYKSVALPDELKGHNALLCYCFYCRRSNIT